jgi:hypothetical protein
MSETTLRAWAIPLGFQVFGQEIGDHTWVTGEDRYCDGCRFGVVSNPDPFYCSADRWATGKYVPPSNPPSRELGNKAGSSVTAKCLGGAPYNFMGIPAQSGIIYAINGVCHTLSNRILYRTGLTVEGALGYWFIKSIFGVHGTFVPLGYIPPVILIPWPPFVVPNPLYAVALAVLAAINIEWANIRSRCGVSLPEDASAYLRAVDAIHTAPLQSTPRDQWSAEALFALQQELYERHIHEVELTIEHRGSGIDQAKLDSLLNLWKRVHQPVRADLDAFFGERENVSLRTLPPAQLSEADAFYLANFMNLRVAETLKEVIGILGGDDFKTFYGHRHDVPFLVIEPDILKGAATKPTL